MNVQPVAVVLDSWWIYSPAPNWAEWLYRNVQFTTVLLPWSLIVPWFADQFRSKVQFSTCGVEK